MLGVGLGSAGQNNRDAGVVTGATSNFPGWSGMRVRERLNEQTGLPISIDNDANAMALGEAWVGAGREWSHFICVTLGTGVGGGLIINGQPYLGNQGYAGELGHHVIQADGYPCNCGRTGCWEQYASVTGLMRMVRESVVDSVIYSSSEVVFARAREGDVAALELVEQYTEYIAIGLANLVHLFDPQGIVIGGAITKQGDFLFDRINRDTARSLLSVYRESSAQINIVPAMLGNYGGVIGAAAMILHVQK